MAVRDFNGSVPTACLAMGLFRLQTLPFTRTMTSTKINLPYGKVARMADVADLAELLFPGNRNQQHAFLVLWFALKWAPERIVPNLPNTARDHGISRRTYERVRAKMRRMGMIDHVSRFNAGHGYRDGWVLSTRFERALGQLARTVSELKDTISGARDKDQMLVRLALARREVAGGGRQSSEDEPSIHSGGATS